METQKKLSCLRHLLDEDMARLLAAETALRHRLTDWLRDNHYLSLNLILQNYLDMTEEHAEKLADFLELEKAPPALPSSPVMEAFLEEVDRKLDLCSCQELKEACLLGGIQAINHYKISAYGTAAAFAQAVESKHAAAVFHQAESDEKDIDQRLSHLARHEINLKAKAPILLTNT